MPRRKAAWVCYVCSTIVLGLQEPTWVNIHAKVRVLAYGAEAFFVQKLALAQMRSSTITSTALSNCHMWMTRTIVLVLIKGGIVIGNTFSQSNEVFEQSLDPLKDIIKAFSFASFDLWHHLEHLLHENLLFFQLFCHIIRVLLARLVDSNDCQQLCHCILIFRVRFLTQVVL